jgi:TolB protein
MNDLYRTMAIGATRVYVKPEGPLTINSYLSALKKGKSFVSNGPLVEFEVDGKIPGEVVEAGQKKVRWKLKVHAPIAFDKVEIFVNGNVVATKKGMSDTTSKTYKGTLTVPAGGWVTVRVSGGDIKWPLMDSYPYAETSPIWFNNIGSINTASAKESAQILLNLLEVSKSRLNYGYGSNPIPKLNAHFEKARLKLLAIIKDQ